MTRTGRLDPDAKGGLRLTLAVAAGLLLAVPFGLLLLLVVDHWGPLQRLDVALAERLNSYAFPHPGYVAVLKAITNGGSPTVFELLAVLIGVLLLVGRQPRLGGWLLVTVFGGGLLSTLVKAGVGRPRPLLPHPVAHAANASFPSGHALGSIVGVGALLLVVLPRVHAGARPWLVAIGALAVLAVGFSRLGLGVHYLSDVVGGWVLGAGWLVTTTAAFAAWRRDRGMADRALSAGLERPAPESA